MLDSKKIMKSSVYGKKKKITFVKLYHYFMNRKSNKITTLDQVF